MTRPWAIYCRISYAHRTADGTVETLGVDRQEPPARALVERLGGQVVRVFVDNDRSAYSGTHRPAYAEMLTWAAEGRIAGIAAWHADRLTRQPVENERLIALAEGYGVQLATVTGEHDLSTPSGRLHFRMLGSIARYESEHRAERLRLKHDEKAAAGQVKGGGVRAFGYERDGITINEPEAELLREAARRLLDEREPLGAILRDWRDRGITTPTGKGWTTTSLRRALCSPRVAGLRQHRGQVVGTAIWPAIVSEATHERLVAVFVGAQRKRQGRVRTYLYSGMLRCGRPECGRAMVGASQGAGYALYACKGGPRDPDHRGCGRTWISKAAFEAVMDEAVLARILSPAFERLVNTLASAATGDVPSTVEADRAQLDELARLHGQGRIGLSEWLAAREPIQERIRAAEARLAALPDVQALLDLPRIEADLRRAWASEWSLERKRRVLAALLTEIVILPKGRGSGGGKFDPNRIDPRWKV